MGVDRAFPPEEYETRWERLRVEMAEKAVDSLLLTTRENVLYACGFDTYAWYGRPITFVLPLASPPLLVIPLNELGNAEELAYCPEVRTWGSFDPAKRDQIDPIVFLVTTIKDLGLVPGRIATEQISASGLTPVGYKRLESLLDKQTLLIDVASVMGKVRSTKSPQEIAYIAKACEATCEGYRAGLSALREGITEDEVARLMWRRMIEMGCDLGDHAGHIILRGGPERNRCFGAVPSRKRLVNGDLIKIDGGSRVRGYCCDMARFGAIGEPTREQQRMYEANVAAGKAAIGAMRPGATTGDVFEAAVSVLREYGYEELALTRSDTIFGHSVGMHVHEYPGIAAGGRDIIEANMVFAIEPQLNAYPPDFRVAIFSVEDMVLVTEEAPKVLTPIQRELYLAR